MPSSASTPFCHWERDWNWICIKYRYSFFLSQPHGHDCSLLCNWSYLTFLNKAFLCTVSWFQTSKSNKIFWLGTAFSVVETHRTVQELAQAMKPHQNCVVEKWLQWHNCFHMNISEVVQMALGLQSSGALHKSGHVLCHTNWSEVRMWH